MLTLGKSTQTQTQWHAHGSQWAVGKRTREPLAPHHKKLMGSCLGFRNKSEKQKWKCRNTVACSGLVTSVFSLEKEKEKKTTLISSDLNFRIEHTYFTRSGLLISVYVCETFSKRGNRVQTLLRHSINKLLFWIRRFCAPRVPHFLQCLSSACTIIIINTTCRAGHRVRRADLMTCC